MITNIISQQYIKWIFEGNNRTILNTALLKKTKKKHVIKSFKIKLIVAGCYRILFIISWKTLLTLQKNNNKKTKTTEQIFYLNLLYSFKTFRLTYQLIRKIISLTKKLRILQEFYLKVFL